jgi:hypothetical protein
MTIRKETKCIRSGEYLAEVIIELREYEGKEWSPALSLDDARKLERVRKALDRGDIGEAAKDAVIYRVERVAVG